MSGFLMHWAPPGPPLSPDEVARATRALEHAGPDGVRVQVADGVTALHARFDVADGAEDDLPLLTDQWLLTGALRVDDRATLRARLRDAGVEPAATAGDVRLFEAALRTWGAETPRHVIGDYAVAAFDRRARRLLVLRSALGVQAVHAMVSERECVVAGSIAQVRSVCRTALALDPEALDAFLATGIPATRVRTPWRAIERLPAGHAWSIESGRAHRQRVWEYPSPPPLVGADAEEIVEGFRAVLALAVRDRLRGANAAILLSGGLDSGAIAATACDLRPRPALTALTVGTDPVMVHDEPIWAARVAASLGLPHHVMRDAEDSILRHLDAPDFATDEPIDEPETLSLRRQVAWLSERTRSTLYGEDGDALLAAPPLIAILRTRPWRETVRAWREYRRTTRLRPWMGLRDHPLLRGRRSGAAAPPTPWLRGSARLKRPASPDNPWPRHAARPIAVEQLGSPLVDAFLSEVSPANMGIAHQFLFPLLDPRVIAFVFSIPPIPWCQRKTLLRSAFARELPPDVLMRPKTPLRGYDEAMVARWRARGGAERALPKPMDDLVDVAVWRERLRTGSVSEVRAAWRVFELSRWLSQPGIA